MSKDLKKRGFRFVGTTICYAFMQAVGMVKDHAPGCFRCCIAPQQFGHGIGKLALARHQRHAQERCDAHQIANSSLLSAIDRIPERYAHHPEHFGILGFGDAIGQVPGEKRGALLVGDAVGKVHAEHRQPVLGREPAFLAKFPLRGFESAAHPSARRLAEFPNCSSPAESETAPPKSCSRFHRSERRPKRAP